MDGGLEAADTVVIGRDERIPADEADSKILASLVKVQVLKNGTGRPGGSLATAGNSAQGCCHAFHGSPVFRALNMHAHQAVATANSCLATSELTACYAGI